MTDPAPLHSAERDFARRSLDLTAMRPTTGALIAGRWAFPLSVAPAPRCPVCGGVMREVPGSARDWCPSCSLRAQLVLQRSAVRSLRALGVSPADPRIGWEDDDGV